VSPAPPSLGARLLRALVRAYRLILSPILPPSCRFEPSCSRYAEEALTTHGALRGGWLTPEAYGPRRRHLDAGGCTMGRR
jgi:putative component of membrane protein insertase Oxa1/YidC/SpoIIIJ protein YidD